MLPPASTSSPTTSRSHPKKNQSPHRQSLRGLGETGAFNPANIRADPNIFDKLFEMFGVTEKTKEEPEENGN